MPKGTHVQHFYKKNIPRFNHLFEASPKINGASATKRNLGTGNISCSSPQPGRIQVAHVTGGLTPTYGGLVVWVGLWQCQPLEGEIESTLPRQVALNVPGQGGRMQCRHQESPAWEQERLFLASQCRGEAKTQTVRGWRSCKSKKTDEMERGTSEGSGGSGTEPRGF